MSIVIVTVPGITWRDDNNFGPEVFGVPGCGRFGITGTQVDVVYSVVHMSLRSGTQVHTRRYLTSISMNATAMLLRLTTLCSAPARLK